MERKHRVLSRKGRATILVEKLGIGILIVSTDCAIGPRQLLMDEEFGSLPPVNNSEAVAQVTLGAFDDPPPAGSLQREATALNLRPSFNKHLRHSGKVSDQ